MSPATFRSVIVTGDDFGVSSPVNRATIEAHERGILTSASLMVTGEALEDAVALARRHPALAVGLHLVLISGRSTLPHSEIPHLVDREGRFSSQPVWAGLQYQLNPAARRELRAEIRAQLERFRRTGLELSHVDGHRNMHLPPAVLKILLELRGEFGIRAIRLPSEELGIALALDRRRWLEKVILSRVFRGVRTLYAERVLACAGVEFTERVYGLLQSGRMTEEHLLKLIPRICADRVEIYTHPTAQEDCEASGYGASRAQLEALLSPRVREALSSRGFRLSTYHGAAGECIGSYSSSS